MIVYDSNIIQYNIYIVCTHAIGQIKIRGLVKSFPHKGNECIDTIITYSWKYIYIIRYKLYIYTHTYTHVIKRINLTYDWRRSSLLAVAISEMNWIGCVLRAHILWGSKGLQNIVLISVIIICTR